MQNLSQKIKKTRFLPTIYPWPYATILFIKRKNLFPTISKADNYKVQNDGKKTLRNRTTFSKRRGSTAIPLGFLRFLRLRNPKRSIALPYVPPPQAPEKAHHSSLPTLTTTSSILLQSTKPQT
jgi:hypothetical protein